MMTPQATLQGKVGNTRNFVVGGKFVRFRALVPKIVSPRMAERLKGMQRNGQPLFKVIYINDMKGPVNNNKKCAPTILHNKVQNVIGNAEESKEENSEESGNSSEWQQETFA